jgi:hypothetical protein
VFGFVIHQFTRQKQVGIDGRSGCVAWAVERRDGVRVYGSGRVVCLGEDELIYLETDLALEKRGQDGCGCEVEGVMAARERRRERAALRRV